MFLFLLNFSHQTLGKLISTKDLTSTSRLRILCVLRLVWQGVGHQSQIHYFIGSPGTSILYLSLSFLSLHQIKERKKDREIKIKNGREVPQEPNESILTLALPPCLLKISLWDDMEVPEESFHWASVSWHWEFIIVFSFSLLLFTPWLDIIWITNTFIFRMLLSRNKEFVIYPPI